MIITDESQKNLRLFYRKSAKLKTWILRNGPPTQAKIHKRFAFLS